MKNHLLLLFVLILLSACSEKPLKYPWIEDDYTLAPKDGKIIMIDFWSPNCGPCVKYLKTTFKDERVIKYAQENLHSYKYDAWIKENVDLQRKFVKFGVPFIVFLDQNLNEIDFITEYLAPDDFLKELKRIKNGENTFKAAKLNYENNPENPAALYNYTVKLDRKEGPLSPEVFNLYSKYTSLVQSNSYENDYAKFRISFYNLYENNNPKSMRSLLKEIQFRDFTIGGMEQVAIYYRKNNETLKLSDFYKEFENKIYSFINNNKDYRFYQFLNRMAWDFYELDMEPELRCKWIKYSVENATGTEMEEFLPDYFDTYARILFAQGDIDKAKTALEKGLKLSPRHKDLIGTKNFFNNQQNL